jgi:hypothetical protein
VAKDRNDRAELYRRMKVTPNDKMRKSAHEAMSRFAEHQVQAQLTHRRERDKALAPIYDELRTAVQKSPELAGVVKAVNAFGRNARPHTHPHVGHPSVEKNPAPVKKPSLRTGSIHIVDSLPFYSDTWSWQQGAGVLTAPSADGNTGNMSFTAGPGIDGSGQMAGWAALGVAFNVPNQPCLIEFTAAPSLSWNYSEWSTWWRESAANMWIGQYVGVFNADGTFLNNPVNTQISVASFDDRNFLDSSSNSGTTTAMPLSSSVSVDLPSVFGNADDAAAGGVVEYWCWMGFSCNAYGDQSGQSISMNANCSNLFIDIFEL